MSSRSSSRGTDDWVCSDSQCGNLNFARRLYCNRCGRDKDSLPSKRPSTEIGKAAAERSRGLFSADDWQCAKCGNVNWARRVQCNVCNAPRVGDVEERTGYGGGYNERENVEYIDREESDGEYDEFGRKKKQYRDPVLIPKPEIKEVSANVEDEEEEEDKNEEEEDDKAEAALLSKYKLDSDEDDEDGDLSKYNLGSSDEVSQGGSGEDSQGSSDGDSESLSREIPYSSHSSSSYPEISRFSHSLGKGDNKLQASEDPPKNDKRPHSSSNSSRSSSSCTNPCSEFMHPSAKKKLRVSSGQSKSRSRSSSQDSSSKRKRSHSGSPKSKRSSSGSPERSKWTKYVKKPKN